MGIYLEVAAIRLGSLLADERMTDDDRNTLTVLRGAGRKYEVTIYSGTDCKLYDAGCDGELFGR